MTDPKSKKNGDDDAPAEEGEEGITVDEFWGASGAGEPDDEFGYMTPSEGFDRKEIAEAMKKSEAEILADAKAKAKAENEEARLEAEAAKAEFEAAAAAVAEAEAEAEAQAEAEAEAKGKEEFELPEPPFATASRSAGLVDLSSSAHDDDQPILRGNKGEVGETLITADGLCKYYGPFKAIEDVSFTVRRGQVVAFLGPNGAGKSTTMKILTGVIAPDRGRAEIDGLSVIDDRLQVATRLGYLPENGPLYDDMTPRSLLRFLGQARRMSSAHIEDRIEILRERLHLRTVMGKPIHKLSRGYRQRVGLAQALLHEPDVLIMDEPTAGLDPNQIRDVRRVIQEFGRDKAVLLSTHILQEVEAIADRVVFIHEGEIAFKGTVDALRRDGANDLERAFANKTGYSAATWSGT